MSAIKAVVGIDIGVQQFEACWCDEQGHTQHIKLEQNVQDWCQLKRQVEQGVGQAVRVVMEATSTYWMGIACFLDSAGWQVHVVNPKHAHYFAESYRRYHKTDRIDAQLLMQMGLERSDRLETWSAPPACYEELYQRLVWREQLLDNKTRLRHLAHSFAHRPHGVLPEITASMTAQREALDRQIEVLDKEIEHILRTCQWQHEAAYLLSIKGIGPLTTAWLLVATVGFTTCESAEQLVAYAGLAPREFHSGSSVHKRPHLPPGGHARLRRHLFMAARSASVHNPRLRDRYQALLARGKPKKLAHCAIARKLAVIAFTLVKKETYYDPDFHLIQPTAA